MKEIGAKFFPVALSVAKQQESLAGPYPFSNH